MEKGLQFPWPHAPTHRLDAAGTYFVSVGTYLKAHHFRSPKRLEVLERGLLKTVASYEWRMEAWAVFSNHYHFVAKTPEGAASGASLSSLIKDLHGPLSLWVSKLDNASERQVWHNYHDTLLTEPTSYFARLNYTHQNAVKHRLVHRAKDYPWCSAAWFERVTSAAMVRSIQRFGIERVNVEDDFDPVLKDGSGN